MSEGKAQMLTSLDLIGASEKFLQNLMQAYSSFSFDFYFTYARIHLVSFSTKIPINSYFLTVYVGKCMKSVTSTNICTHEQIEHTRFDILCIYIVEIHAFCIDKQYVLYTSHMRVHAIQYTTVHIPINSKWYHAYQLTYFHSKWHPFTSIRKRDEPCF